MAEAILFNLAREILSKLGSSLIQQIGLAWAIKKDLRMIENKISTLRNVLLDVQDRQITNLAVKDWLRRLKLVFYDAEDLLDEVATEALTRQVETHKSMIKREVSHFFTTSNPIVFCFDVARKIKDIKERLDEIVSEMRDFNFVVQVVEKPIEIKKKRRNLILCAYSGGYWERK
ncbi:putative disease resistance protein RGA3 [Camellia lanceoleosa]|uniref:Disease resistance protein RGA3 n=1 Tax=Camellia lanceoleosa TaxID=1840588 RepID=A0ACC0FTV8_9ERIC|nr:putative disease resistance protein RGA3 [Camellia lanceoleosa]